MRGLGGLGRVGLAVVAFGLVVFAVVVATEGTTFPGLPTPSPALAPTAAVGCSAAGPYRAPDQGSVGVPAAIGLCSSGPVVVTSPGAVLDGWDVRGGIVVEAADVVVRRSRITGDGSSRYGIQTVGAGSARIEDTTITGEFEEAGIGEDRWTAERVEIIGVTHDGARMGSGATLRNSWLHDFAPAGAESAALTLPADGGDVLVEDNRIDMGTGPGHGSAVLIAPGRTRDRADGGPVVIRGNVLAGGQYTLRQATGSGVFADVRITGNRFRRDSELGPLRVAGTAVLLDNTFVDGGPIPAR